ncbi:coadhesin-like [Lingula anatina]|uniref:Coadhesin-like n=1 Tax=Lingula anatina TaxID=7574 RepID=A0A1S3I4C1_LINAN|nr:coadhesin-like [Lingula anatina]|eukprot:XP_013392214.1 coadhesin-like [Lingula anatina]
MGGNRTRTRTCSNPEPQHGGTDCVGNNTETAECAVVACCSMSLHTTGRRITSGTQLLYAITSTKEECVNLCCADNDCKYANWRNDGENACKTFSDWSGYTQGQSVPFDYFY